MLYQLAWLVSLLSFFKVVNKPVNISLEYEEKHQGTDELKVDILYLSNNSVIFSCLSLYTGTRRAVQLDGLAVLEPYIVQRAWWKHREKIQIGAPSLPQFLHFLWWRQIIVAECFSERTIRRTWPCLVKGTFTSTGTTGGRQHKHNKNAKSLFFCFFWSFLFSSLPSRSVAMLHGSSESHRWALTVFTPGSQGGKRPC